MMKQQSSKLLCVLLGLVAGLVVARGVGAETSQAARGTMSVFLIRGVVANAKGPLANKAVVVMPIDANEGRPVTRQSGASSTLRLDGKRNPKTDKEIIKFDPNAATVEVGRLVFKPVREPTK